MSQCHCQSDWWRQLQKCLWPPAALTDLRTSVEATLAKVGEVLDKSNSIMEVLNTMAVDVSKLQQDAQTLAQGYQALQAENKQLRDELANADASAQARVDAAVAAEDADAQAKIDAADQVLSDVLNPPAPAPDQPPADQPPADQNA